MATREIVALNEGVPQLQVPGASDTYLMARDMDGGGNDITNLNSLASNVIDGVGVDNDATSYSGVGRATSRPIVIAALGNSLTGSWLAGTAPTTLVANSSVLIWQAAAANTQTASFATADHAASTIDPGTSRMVGYCKGQIGAKYLEAANRIQKETGKLVLVIPAYLASAESALFSTARGDTDSEYDPYSRFSANNNMWYWCSTAINNALAAIQAGTSGMPAAYPDIDYVDMVICDIAAGDAVLTSSFYGSHKTMQLANTEFVTDMTAFIAGAETGVTIGGWAKKFFTRWYSCATPKGSALGGGVGTALSLFDGNDRLANSIQSLFWTVPMPSGLQTASDTTLGTIDGLHWNSITELTSGDLIGRMWLEVPHQNNKTPKGIGSDFMSDVDAQGFDLLNLGRIANTGGHVGPIRNISLASGNGTITIDDWIITTSGTLTANRDLALPPVATCTGQVFTISTIGNAGSGPYVVYLNPDGSELFVQRFGLAGQNSLAISPFGETIQIYSNGTYWYVLFRQFHTPLWTTKSATSSLAIYERNVVVTAAGATTQTLPSAADSFGMGPVTIKNTGAGTVTVARNGATIDGAAADRTLTSGEIGIYSPDQTSAGNWYVLKESVI